ncbi:MAG TPA: hypothetical protein VIJ07_25265 [Dermatophilaceae bacterium]
MRDVANLVRDVQHLPDQLVRSGLLFAPASMLTPSVERLHERTAGRYVSVVPEEVFTLPQIVRSTARATDLAVRHVGQCTPKVQLGVAGFSIGLSSRVPEL